MCSFLLLFSFYLYISVARAPSLRRSLSFSAASEGILHSWTVGTLFFFACSTSLATCRVVLARRTLARHWNKRIDKRPLCYLSRVGVVPVSVSFRVLYHHVFSTSKVKLYIAVKKHILIDCLLAVPSVDFFWQRSLEFRCFRHPFYPSIWASILLFLSTFVLV